MPPDADPAPPAIKYHGFVRRFFSSLGPALITGAANDDPSGVATYSIAGAELGTSLLWTAFLTWPLMGAVQMTCARIGMVTGKGLSGAFHHKFPRWLIVVFRFRAPGREHDQCGGRSGGHGGCRGDAHRVKLASLCHLLWCR